MFGTIAKMKFKPGSYEKMQEIMQGFEERQVKGFQFNAVYRSQADPDEVELPPAIDFPPPQPRAPEAEPPRRWPADPDEPPDFPEPGE